MNRPEATTPEAKSGSREREPLLGKLRGSKSVKAITGAAFLSVMLTVASCADQTGAPGPEGQSQTESPVVGTNSASPEALIAAGADYEQKFGEALLSANPEREAVMEQLTLEMTQTIVEYMAAEGKSSVQEVTQEIAQTGRTWTMTNGDSPMSDEVQDGPPISMSVMAPEASNVGNNKPSLRFHVGVSSEYAHIRDPGLLTVDLDIKEGWEENLPLPASSAGLSAFAEWLGSPEAAEALEPQFVELPEEFRDAPKSRSAR